MWRHPTMLSCQWGLSSCEEKWLITLSRKCPSISINQLLRCNFSLLKKKKKPWFLHFFKCDNVFKHFLQHMKTRVLPLLWSIYLWKKVVKHGTHALAMHDGQSQCCHLTFISLFARNIVVWPFGYFLVFLNVKEIVHFKVVMEILYSNFESKYF